MMQEVVEEMNEGSRHKQPVSLGSHVPILAFARHGLAQSGYCLRPRVAAEAEAARAARMMATRMMKSIGDKGEGGKLQGTKVEKRR